MSSFSKIAWEWILFTVPSVEETHILCGTGNGRRSACCGLLGSELSSWIVCITAHTELILSCPGPGCAWCFRTGCQERCVHECRTVESAEFKLHLHKNGGFDVMKWTHFKVPSQDLFCNYLCYLPHFQMKLLEGSIAVPWKGFLNAQLLRRWKSASSRSCFGFLKLTGSPGVIILSFFQIGGEKIREIFIFFNNLQSSDYFLTEQESFVRSESFAVVCCSLSLIKCYSSCSLCVIRGFVLVFKLLTTQKSVSAVGIRAGVGVTAPRGCLQDLSRILDQKKVVSALKTMVLRQEYLSIGVCIQTLQTKDPFTIFPVTLFHYCRLFS